MKKYNLTIISHTGIGCYDISTSKSSDKKHLLKCISTSIDKADSFYGVKISIVEELEDDREKLYVRNIRL